MFHLCRVCLATEETFKFESIFDNNGKGAKEIFLLSGLRVRIYLFVLFTNLANIIIF